MLCPNCGTENAEGLLFCTSCGRALPGSGQGAPQLQWETEDGTPQSINLTRNVSIGRIAGNDVVIPDSALSRQHARVEMTPEGFNVIDLGSLNGVFVNDERVEEVRDLQDGDAIRIGRTRLTVRLPQPEPQPEPAPAAEEAPPPVEATVFVDSAAPPEPAEEPTVMADQGLPPTAMPSPSQPAGHLVAGDERIPIYESLTIGRAANNDVAIENDRMMSRNHARMEVRGNEIWVEDLDSGNGTFVNRDRVTAPVMVPHLAEIRFGSSVFQFESTSPEAAASPPRYATTAPLPTVPAAEDEGATIAASAPELGDMTLEGSEADLYIREAELAEFQAMRGRDTEPVVPSADPVDQYRLIVNFGPESGRHFILYKDVTVIGREAPGEDYDISLNDRAVSRPHAKVIREAEGYVVHDLDSANGTWMNYTEELTDPRRLVDGDIIKLGKTTMVYRVPAAVRPAAREIALDPEIGQVISLFSLKGGVGTTTLAVNLAVLLRQLTSQPVLLVDLSSERGAASVHLNLAPRLTLGDLPAEPGIIDLDLLHSLITSHSTGIDLLPAPPSPQTAELVTSAAVSAILPLVRGRYKWVVVDTSSTFSELNLGVFDQSDLLLLVTAPDVASLKVLQATLDIFAALQTPAEKRVLVLNFTHAKAHLSQDDLEKALGERIGVVVPYGGDDVLDSIDKGNPLAASDPDHPTVETIKTFAAKLGQVKATAEEKPRRGGFGSWVQGVIKGRK